MSSRMKTPSTSAWFIYSLFSGLTPTFDREPKLFEREISKTSRALSEVRDYIGMKIRTFGMQAEGISERILTTVLRLACPEI
jgi:hypothetical protein